MKKQFALFWFRRDLRLEDNCGLYHALSSGLKVVLLFIFDPHILNELRTNDARVSFIYNRLRLLNRKLQAVGASVCVRKGDPLTVFRKLNAAYKITAVYTNTDYEPYARERDAKVKNFLKQESIDFFSFKDQVVFEKSEIVKTDGTPYQVFTPYLKKWKSKLASATGIEFWDSLPKLSALTSLGTEEFPTLENLGFTPASIVVPDYDLEKTTLQHYKKQRDFPALEKGTSHLGPHLRFGTISVRKAVTKALSIADGVFLSELVWREFFMQILWHHPQTQNQAFKPKYDRISWRNNTEEFKRWQKGETGYAIVDAGMRQLVSTGYMHNRVRMLTASFLCKHLLIDWRWGEAYFAQHLLDYELASNVGNWQWAAGCGVDAAPYFRIFNPTMQQVKFDPESKYIKRWVKNLNQASYPAPMVAHKMARKRCLDHYKAALR